MLGYYRQSAHQIVAVFFQLSASRAILGKTLIVGFQLAPPEQEEPAVLSGLGRLSLFMLDASVLGASVACTASLS
jgi:hypothetical protein